MSPILLMYKVPHFEVLGNAIQVLVTKDGVGQAIVPNPKGGKLLVISISETVAVIANPVPSSNGGGYSVTRVVKLVGEEELPPELMKSLGPSKSNPTEPLYMLKTDSQVSLPEPFVEEYWLYMNDKSLQRFLKNHPVTSIQ